AKKGACSPVTSRRRHFPLGPGLHGGGLPLPGGPGARRAVLGGGARGEARQGERVRAERHYREERQRSVLRNGACQLHHGPWPLERRRRRRAAEVGEDLPARVRGDVRDRRPRLPGGLLLRPRVLGEPPERREVCQEPGAVHRQHRGPRALGGRPRGLPRARARAAREAGREAGRAAVGGAARRPRLPPYHLRRGDAPPARVGCDGPGRLWRRLHLGHRVRSRHARRRDRPRRGLCAGPGQHRLSGPPDQSLPVPRAARDGHPAAGVRALTIAFRMPRGGNEEALRKTCSGPCG
ncbi:unnamed protein product, partial [Prorocentrum cordatum]